MSRRATWIALALGFLALIGFIPFWLRNRIRVSEPPRYPQYGLFRIDSGTGFAYTLADTHRAPVDSAAIPDLARFGLHVVSITPFDTERGDILVALRRANPEVIILGHAMLERWWPSDSSRANYISRWSQLVQRAGALKRNPDGTVSAQLDNVNLAMIVGGAVDLLDSAWATNRFDGFLLETDGPEGDTLISRLRRRLPDAILMQSSGPAGAIGRGAANGNFCENCMSQHGGWHANMRRYLDTTLYARPHVSLWTYPIGRLDAIDAPNSLRACRAVTMSAAMGEGYAALLRWAPTPSDGNGRWPLPWAPGSFGPAKGRAEWWSVGSITGRPAWPDSVLVRRFEKGLGVVNWRGLRLTLRSGMSIGPYDAGFDSAWVDTGQVRRPT